MENQIMKVVGKELFDRLPKDDILKGLGVGVIGFLGVLVTKIVTSS